jgi:hypothetical protein
MFFKKSKDQAPELNIQWDLNADNYIKSLDWFPKDEFHTLYPNGFAVGEVEVDKIYDFLEDQSKIYDVDDLWKTADKSKTLGVIESWYNGIPLTPPLLNISCNKRIVIVGGNHRFNVFRIYGKGLLIFLVPFDIKDSISNIIGEAVRWIK